MMMRLPGCTHASATVLHHATLNPKPWRRHNLLSTTHACGCSASLAAISQQWADKPVPGPAYPLYAPQVTVPEMQRSNLVGMVLQLKVRARVCLGVHRVVRVRTCAHTRTWQQKRHQGMGLVARGGWPGCVCQQGVQLVQRRPAPNAVTPHDLCIYAVRTAHVQALSTHTASCLYKHVLCTAQAAQQQ